MHIALSEPARWLGSLLLGLCCAAPQLAAADPAHILSSWSASMAAVPAGGMTMHVDLTDVAVGGLWHARLVVPLPARSSATEVTLHYPLWTPGTHAPSGPVHNLGRLIAEDDHGARLTWRRDVRDPWRFAVAVPATAAQLILDLSYIGNQANENSIGVDCLSSPRHAILNWNCLLLLPDGDTARQVTARLRLPPQWQQACVLPARPADGVLEFPTVPAVTLIDSPLIAGARVQLFGLGDCAGSPLRLAVVSDGTDARLSDEQWLVRLRRMGPEAAAIFGRAWFDRYDVLWIAAEEGHMGLEHARCSLNGTDREALDFARADFSARSIMPHEFVHSWVGKHRRPHGMCTPGMQEHPDTSGLWIYEGLTTYYGHVLAARSGLLTTREFTTDLADTITHLDTTPGRTWRSIRDTCVAGYQLRARSRFHGQWRRGQDYYPEGGLFWLMADLRIRAASQGRFCLDDLATEFFGPASGTRMAFEEYEVIALLARYAPGYDWPALVARWIDGTGPIDPALLHDSGWRHVHGPLPADGGGMLDLVDRGALWRSLGIVLDDDHVYAVRDGSPAARVGIRERDRVHTVGGATVAAPDQTQAALAAAAVASLDTGKVDMQLERGNRTFTRTIPLRGVVLSRLERAPHEPDRLSPIAAARTATAPASAATQAAPAPASQAAPALGK